MGWELAIEQMYEMQRLPAMSENRVAPAADTDAEILLAAATNKRYILNGIAWSYDAEPTGGNLVIREGGTPVFEIDICTCGPGFIPVRMSFTKTTAVQLVLLAGGAAVSGKLNIIGRYDEPA